MIYVASIARSLLGLICQGCSCEVEKGDAQFVDEDSFAFLPEPPVGISLGAYCVPCFDSKVSVELDRYNEKMELAKNVNVFYATQSKESRFVRRTERPVKVENCDDREETILRLAFLAVELGKNSIVDVELKSEKVRNGGYQTSIWSGRGIPAHIDDSVLQRRFRGPPN